MSVLNTKGWTEKDWEVYTRRNRECQVDATVREVQMLREAGHKKPAWELIQLTRKAIAGERNVAFRRSLRERFDSKLRVKVGADE